MPLTLLKAFFIYLVFKKIYKNGKYHIKEQPYYNYW